MLLVDVLDGLLMDRDMLLVWRSVSVFDKKSSIWHTFAERRGS